MTTRSTHTKAKTVTAWVVALTAIGSLMAALDTLVVSTALSTIQRDLGASVEQHAETRRTIRHFRSSRDR